MDADEPVIPEKSAAGNNSWKWFKRIGVAGFLFFLIKGLIWLYVIYAIGRCNLD